MQDAVGPRGGLREVEPVPVVGHDARQGVLPLRDGDAHMRRARVLADVRDRLLHGAIDELLDRPLEPLPGDVHRHLGAHLGPDLLDHRGDRRGHPLLVQHGRPQLEREPARALGGLLERLARPLQGDPHALLVAGRLEHPVDRDHRCGHHLDRVVVQRRGDAARARPPRPGASPRRSRAGAPPRS